MKNDSTSDQVINTTATDICDVLENLSAGTHTIKINGEINNETLIAINKTLQDLNNPDTLINLDLSDTTGLTSIGNFAFGSCKSLTSVTIPDSVTSIGNFAFCGCDSLTSVTIPDSVISIGDKAFSGCESLIVFDVSANNKNYSSSDDGKILYNKDKTKLIAYPTAAGDVTILDSVTYIGKWAFWLCESLTSVTIPNSVTSIGDWAFCGCESLTNVIISDNMTSIGTGAFSGCKSLTSVIIPNSVTEIGTGAFSGCSNLKSITLPDGLTSIENGAFMKCSSLKSIALSDGLTSIGDAAFLGCLSMENIVIPHSLTSIEKGSFLGCENLAAINYKGAKKDWDAINIADNNDALINANIIFNYTEE